jgi:hypothetical protein
MGCTVSRQNNRTFASVDDSIHVLLSRDIKNKESGGQISTGYRPRAPHPLIDIAVTESDIVDDDDHHHYRSASNEDMDISRLLFHTKCHCDTIDSRDLTPHQRQRTIVPTAC